VLPWVGTASLAAATVMGLRWLGRRSDALGRRRPFPWFSVAFLVVVGCAVLAVWLSRIHLEHRLGDAATAIVGSPVKVHCQTFGEAFVDAGAEFGFVRFGPNGVPEKETLIKRDHCDDLSDYLSSKGREPNLAQVVAVHTLTHEAMHMSGVADDSETECLAVQHDAEMARQLGASPGAARTLALKYWEMAYPRMPADYRSSQCGPGLALDAGLPDAPWDLAVAGS
jgi:hypothetical protein